MEGTGNTREPGGGAPGRAAVPADRLLALWGLGLAAVYALTLRPTIGWNDTPEFIDVAHTLGIAHPPGYPTYALLGKLLTLLPLGSIAVRVNLMSALCAAGAALLLALCTRRLHVRAGGSPGAGLLGGMLCGTLLATAPTYWSYATQAEVYAPLSLVVALLVYLALRWDEKGDRRYLFAGAFLFGLSGGIHGTVIFFAPALLFLALSGTDRERRWRSLGGILFFCILGASVYLYLPLRAAAEPAFNWGHPDSWRRFLSHVSDRKDAAFHFPGTAQPWLPYIAIFAHNLQRELTAAGWLLGLAGLGLLFARSARWGFFTALFCLGNLFFFLRIWTIPDAYLPTFWFVALWAGVASAKLVEIRMPLRRVVAPLVTASLLLAIGLQVRGGAAAVPSRVHDGARSAPQANLLPLDAGALVFATANWFPMRYLQDVEGMRPDVTLVLTSDITLPRYFTPVTQARFPRLKVPAGGGGERRWDEFFQELLRENLGRMPVYWEPLSALNPNVYRYLRPWLYLWRFEPDGPVKLTRKEVDAYFKRLRAFLEGELGEPGVLEDTDAARYHGYLLTVSSEVLRLRKRPQDALVMVELADRVTSDDPTVTNELGRLYSGLLRWNDAERSFRRAAARDPADPLPLLNIAILQMNVGRLDDAAKTIARARAIDPGAPEPYYQLYELEMKKGRAGAARDALRGAIARARDERDEAEWRTILARLEGGEKS